MTKQVQAFALVGMVSGGICSLAEIILPDIEWLLDVYPGVVLGLFLFFSGRYLANCSIPKPWSSLIVLLSAGIVGWRLAVKVGVESTISESFIYAVCGIVGAACVALGLLYAWRIRSGIIPFVVITILSGALGGFIFRMVEWLSGMSSASNNVWWTLSLFTVWQSIFFAGVAVALKYASSRRR